MKLYKNIKLSWVSLVLVTMTIACTDDFDEVNTNPNGPTEVPAELLMPAIIERTSDQIYSTFVGGDMGNCWVQLWSKVQYNDEERYQPRGTSLDGVWNTLYAGNGTTTSTGPLTDAKVMLQLAIEEDNANLQGIAKVMTAYVYSILTDVYGDIPFTEALQAKDGINNPAYTPQSEIYPALLVMLDEANAQLSADGGSISATSDIMYGGDYLKWKKFANSLKFRLLMRMSSRSDFNRQSELQELIDNRVMFTSNSDEAKLVYLSAAPNTNPMYSTIIAGNRGEFKVSSVLVDELSATNDPRLSVYADLNADGIYRGKPAGISDVPNAEYNYDNVSPIGSFYLQPETPGYFLSYAELELLIAEAAHRGLITGQSASAHYNAGIMASMEANGLTSAEYGSYLSNNAYSSSTGMQQIGMQKWIALFGQGIEAWTEWRRTGIPVLSPAIDPISINEIPSRYPYPPSEQSLNGANYADAVAIQGPDRLTTKIWWNK